MSGTPRVPNVGRDPRNDSDVPEPTGKTWFRDVDESVIEAGRCVQCASCVAACPSDSIGIDEDGLPTLVSMCTGCSRCWDYCPRAGLRVERLGELDGDRHLDRPRTYAARAREGTLRAAGQDGGAVTALLAGLLETGALDAALVAREGEEPLQAEAFLATSPAELRECAGSIYNQTMGLGQLEDLLADRGLTEGRERADLDVAVVGTPCVIEGVAALERYQWDDELASVALTVALMCTRSFDYGRLRSLLESEGLDLERVDHLDVTDGTLFAYGDTGEVLHEQSVDEYDPAALDGCAECTDFVGGTADISAGNVGSDPDATTMVVRTERGATAWKRAGEFLDAEPLEAATALDRLESWNRRRAIDTLPRAFDPESPLSITYEEHRAAYDETDRAPAALNPARVYQYEKWC